ncbi:MAG TPA: hypothetical protein PKC69_07775 [Chitinophagaceae bacterium]|nr:hypothetical protein [Chitinophagaceae bacterium]
MRRITLLIFAPLLLSGCKKTIQRIQENRIMDAMTSGQWKVVSFSHNGTSRTAEFSAYVFQFYKSKTVDAIQGPATEKTGVWEGDAENRTIMASFQNVAEPLILLNGTWKIDKNSWTYVEASIHITGDIRKLRLEKL